MKEKYHTAHMAVAKIFADLSYCNRRKVGAIIVNDNHQIISCGYNGTPSGWDNCCEDEQGLTKPIVLHAEKNAILRLAKSNESAKDSIIYVTLAPCLECATLIYSAGIKKVFYLELYKSNDGLIFLNECGIETQQIDVKD